MDQTASGIRGGPLAGVDAELGAFFFPLAYFA